MNRPRAISLALTALTALVIVLLLMYTKIKVNSTQREWPPRHDNEVAIAQEDEYFDVIEELSSPVKVHEQAAPSENPVAESHKSDPAPTSGMDVKDQGKAADAPAPVTSTKPSAVKQTVKEQPKKTGPSAEEIAKQKEEEARRKANSATASAFQRSTGTNNTANNGTTAGNSGSPKGSSASVNGTGTGTVGGGWIIPKYAAVRSTVTGSVKVKVTIDVNGRVTSLSFQGGDAPAATDATVRAAVEKEVRARKFTRTDDAAPDHATAYITYTFK